MGQSGVMVSELCLGTMTFGTQTTEADGHQQMDFALDHGINFVDTAEMYPVNPISKETLGRTEEIIGTWNHANPSRRGIMCLPRNTQAKGSAMRETVPQFHPPQSQKPLRAT